VRRTILFIVFLGFWVHAVAQSSDVLVVGNDTIRCQLKAVHKKGEVYMYFKKIYERDWNEIYAENADFAYISDKSFFLSVKIPEIEKKVWARCFFQGIYQLLEYKGLFYIVDSDKIIKLNNLEEKPEVGKSSASKFFMGQMILFFNRKIDYDFGSLRCDSKSLVCPLIKYHEINKLPYHDYNHYVEVKSDWNICTGGSFDEYRLSTQYGTAVSITNFSPHIGINLILGFPDLSKRLSILGGIDASASKIDILKQQPFGGSIYYYDLSLKMITLAVPVMAEYKIIKTSKIGLTLGTGIKGTKGLLSSQGLTIEKETNNIVRTEVASVKPSPGLNYFHCSDLFVGIPINNKSFSVGASYSYLLTHRPVGNNVISLDHSLLFSVRFTF